jgi:hypothetical protein
MSGELLYKTMNPDFEGTKTKSIPMVTDLYKSMMSQNVLKKWI